MNKQGKMYYIWLDESDKEGTFYSNFYGGILVNSKNLPKVLEMSEGFIREHGMQEEEIKWQKVNKYNFERYKELVDFIFDLLGNGYAKIRIFFRHNQFKPIGLTNEQKRKSYSLLYYQFIKHAFGLEFSNKSDKDIFIKILLDDMPLKGDDANEFKEHLFNLNKDKGFMAARIKIRKEDIIEVDSSKHILLQFLDLILGAMCFRLNDKHKIKDPITGKYGIRTNLKKKLYMHINKKIREIHPGFNIGVSTSITKMEDRWLYPYSHWSFKPNQFERDVSRVKKNK